MDISKLNKKEKFNLLKQLLKDLKPVFKITGEAVDGGKYSEFELLNIKLKSNMENVSPGLETLSAKIGLKDDCFIKYE